MAVLIKVSRNGERAKPWDTIVGVYSRMNINPLLPIYLGKNVTKRKEIH